MKTKLFGMVCAAALACVCSLSAHAAPTLVEVAKLLADDGAENDEFGHSVAVSGDTAVIGAHLHDAVGFYGHSGAAYVFVRSGSSWTQQAMLLADDLGPGDGLGYAVAVSGDTAIIGTPGNDDLGFRAGSAYVFVRSGSSWTQQAKLLADDGAAFDYFGNSVAVSGDTAVIGAVEDDDLGSASGAAYVFVRSGSSWTQQAKLLADDGAASNFFGMSVAVSGNTVVIGADSHDDLGTDSGAAYVFVRSGTSWTQQTELLADDGAAYDYFGWSAAVSSDTAVIGAYRDDDLGAESGSAYVFVRSGSSWTQQAKLLGDDGGFKDWFGMSVAVSGNRAVTSAPGDNFGAGAAYVFVRSDSSWTRQAKLLADDGGSGDRFSWSVAVSKDTAVIGAHADEDLGYRSGSAYVFSVPGLDSVASLADLNSNGSPEIAVAMPGSTYVHIRDASSGTLISDINYGSDPAIDMVVVPDLDGNGFPEIAMLGERPTGQIRVQVKDSATGASVSNLFYGSQYSGLDMALVDDYGGGGLPELAVLGVNASNGTRVQTRDIATDTFLDNLFLGSQTTADGVVSVSDVSGNGLPEVGVMSVFNATSQCRLQVLDADTRVFYTNVWFGNIYTPVELITMATINGGSAEEFVGLGINEVTGGVRVQIRDSGTAAILTNMFLGSANAPVDLAVVSDNNGNGFPEIAVLMETPAGNGIVKVHDSNTGLFIRNVFFNGLIDPVGIVTLPNYAGGPGDEIAVLGTNGGVKRVQIKDSGTNAQINNVEFP